MDGQLPWDYVPPMIESSIGVVVIGRNEGERLRACLASLSDVQTRVYVDSGSSDGSSMLARSLGFEVVELEIPPGFTAARARNAGVERLLLHCPGLAYVQMVDGDCEVQDGWLDSARIDLEADPRRAVVFGRRREVRPHANAYHMACDDEWNAPLGEVSSCGGDALFRLAAFNEVGGYNPRLIAGEEPDLCLRLRQRDWRIWSSGREMTLHDVAIDTLSQWWRRSRRAGFAFAELVDIHKTASDRAWNRLLDSALMWSAVAIATATAAVLGLAFRHPLVVAIAVVFGVMLALQLVRLTFRQRRRMKGFGASLSWACLIMVAKAAQAVGWAQYRLFRVVGARSSIIEYKQ